MPSPQWTRDSAQLQRFIAETFDVPPLGSDAYHKHLVQQVIALTAQWRRKPQEHAFDAMRTTCTARAKFSLALPSKLHVIDVLMTQHPDVWRSVHGRRQHMADDATIQVELRNKNYSWFHTACEDIMRAVAQPSSVRSIAALAPDLEWCCNMWDRYPSLYDYFVPLDVQHRAEQLITCTQTQEWRWQGRRFTLQVLSPHVSLRPDVLEHMAYRISLTAAVGTHPCSHVEMKWFPSNKKKVVRAPPSSQLPPSSCKHCWTPYHINTGATFRNTCDSVTIWRREECYKTVTHELMHGFYWDFDNFPGINRLVQQHFAVARDTEISFFEAYVETWATMFNVYATTAHHHYATPGRCVKHIRAMLAVERAFVMFQVGKILHHSGFRRWREFFHGGTRAASDSGPQLCQRTPVFSYYVVRSAHLWRPEWFVRTFPRMEFRHNARVPWSAWWAQLVSVWGSSEYAARIDQCIALNRNHDRAHDAVVYDTMRMTAHEIF